MVPLLVNVGYCILDMYKWFSVPGNRVEMVFAVSAFYSEFCAAMFCAHTFVALFIE